MSNDRTIAENAAAVDKPMWGIGAISYFFTWIEKLSTTISGQLLSMVAIISVADAFLGGELLHIPWLNIAYALALGVGIEGQFSGVITEAKARAVNGLPGVVFYRIVAFILASIGITTIGVVAYQQAFHVDLATALAALGVPLFWWNWARAFVLFGLIALSANSRYVKPAPRLSTEQELAELERTRLIAEAKQRNRAAAIRGIGGLLHGGIQGAMGRDEVDESPTDVPAYATVEVDESPASASAIDPSSLKGFRVQGKPGYWWDTSTFQQFVMAEYGIGLAMNTAQDIVKDVGTTKKNGGQPYRRNGMPGQPYIAQVFLLKKYAKAHYKPQTARTFQGNLAGELAE